MTSTTPANTLAAARRNRKTQRTKRHIAEIAINLFNQKGYAATTVDEIVDTADYSSSTFFRLFPDKEAVVFFDFDEKLEELKTAFKAAGHPTSTQLIGNVLKTFAESLDAEKELGQIRARLFHKEPALLSRYLTRNLEWEAAMTAMIAPDFDDTAEGKLKARQVAAMAVSAFRSAWDMQIHNPDRSLTECVGMAFDQLPTLSEHWQN